MSPERVLTGEFMTPKRAVKNAGREEKAEEEAREEAFADPQTEEEARLEADEEARLKAEEEARLNAEAEALLKGDGEADVEADDDADEDVKCDAEKADVGEMRFKTSPCGKNPNFSTGLRICFEEKVTHLAWDYNYKRVKATVAYEMAHGHWEKRQRRVVEKWEAVEKKRLDLESAAALAQKNLETTRDNGTKLSKLLSVHRGELTADDETKIISIYAEELQAAEAAGLALTTAIAPTKTRIATFFATRKRAFDTLLKNKADALKIFKQPEKMAAHLGTTVPALLQLKPPNDEEVKRTRDAKKPKKFTAEAAPKAKAKGKAKTNPKACPKAKTKPDRVPRKRKAP